MKKQLRHRLKKYTLTAGAIVTGGAAAEAQIIYTDVDPDSNVIGPGNSYLLDLNNDGTDDFEIFVFSSTDTLLNGTYWAVDAVRITPLNQNGVAGSTSSGYPYAFNAGVPIDDDLTWYFNPNQPLTFEATQGTFVWNGGNWWLGQDFYLGLKLNINSHSYYGWARLTVGSYGEFTVHEYAVLTNPDSTIHAGDTTAVGPIVQCQPAGSLSSYDDYNNGNGSDLRIRFAPPYNWFGPDELGTAEYRVIVVKAADAASFDLSAAQAIPASNYTSVQPTGANYYELYLDPNATDKDGDPITELQPYNYFVLSLADSVYAQLDTLSDSSLVFMLDYIVPVPADTVRNITLADIADFGNEKDLTVSFDFPDDPTGVNYYKVMIVKAEDAAGFDIEKADSLTAGFNERYVYVDPWENQASMEWKVCVDGDSIRPGIPYVAFVVSMPDYTDADTPAMSSPSNEVTLNVPGSDTISDSTAAIPSVVARQPVVIVRGDGKLGIVSEDGAPIDKAALYSINGVLIREVKGYDSYLELTALGLADSIYILEVERLGKREYLKIFITGT